MREILLQFEDAHFERLENLASAVSLDAREYIMMLAARAAPPPKTLRPPGRPPDSPELKETKELARRLAEIYSNLRNGVWNTAPEKFMEKFGAQIVEFEGLVGRRDLIKLREFFNSAPWTR